MRNGSPFFRGLIILLIVMLIFGLLLLAAGIYLDNVQAPNPVHEVRVLLEGRMMS